MAGQNDVVALQRRVAHLETKLAAQPARRRVATYQGRQVTYPADVPSQSKCTDVWHKMQYSPFFSFIPGIANLMAGIFQITFVTLFDPNLGLQGLFKIGRGFLGLLIPFGGPILKCIDGKRDAG